MSTAAASVPHCITGTASSPNCRAILSAAAPISSAARAFARNGSRSTRVVAVLVLAAQDDPQPAGKRVDGLQRRVHIGGFGIVVLSDAVDLAHEFQAMLHRRETCIAALRDLRQAPRPPDRAISAAAITFS